MFLVNKKIDKYLIVYVIFNMFLAGLVTRIILSFLALFSVENLILAYSIVIFVAFMTLGLSILKNSNISTFSTVLSLCLILIFCIYHSPTYLPSIIRILCIILFISVSLINIKKLWASSDTKFIIQFDIINNIKFYVLIFCIAFVIDVFSMIPENINNIFYIVPIVIFALISLNFNKIMNEKIFYSLYIFSTVFIIIYNSSHNSFFFSYIPVMLSIMFCYIIKNQFHKKRIYLILILIYFFQETYFLLRNINFLSEQYDIILTVFGLITNAITVIATFVKIPQKNLKNIFSNFVGDYSLQEVSIQISDYYKNIKKDDCYFGSEYTEAIDYIKNHWHLNHESIKLLNSLEKEAENYNDSTTDKYNKDDTTIVRLMKKVFTFFELHWQLLILIPLLIIYIAVSFPGIHNFISDKFAEQGKIFVLYEKFYYAYDYTHQTIDMLSDKKDISNNITFKEYWEKIYYEKYLEIIKNENSLFLKHNKFLI